MPELPEVETIRRQLDHDLRGYTIVDVKTDWEKGFRPSFKAVFRVIAGKKVESVGRQAKLIIFNLTSDKEQMTYDKSLKKSNVRGQMSVVYLLFHLKLTGRLLVRSPQDPPDDYTRSTFTLIQPVGLSSTRRVSSAKELRFSDSRKFGYVKLISNKKEMEELLKGYGPEPFKDLTLKKFTAALQSSSRPVKTVLLGQEKISGIGNIYANDALWLARIEPRRASNKVTKKQSMDLYKAILVVLKRGLKYGGASDQWYVQAHGEKGQYQEHFLVYGRNGEKCQRCGAIINRISLGGRGTFICANCQPE